VVALDGPSGTGKSTVAKRLADRLAARYLDTGAMYRAVTLAALRAGTELTDQTAVGALARAADLGVGTDPRHPGIELDGRDVAHDIRGAEVTSAVSAVASVPEVRAVLIAHQQRIIAEAIDAGAGIVVEGRDIGTVVAPDAGLKVYLTASAAARAKRRSRQDSAAGRESTPETARVAVDRRDSLDTKTTPLHPADDAVELDSTDLDVAGVLAALESMVDERGMRAAQASNGAVAG
jgi:cytidylate kinase